MLVPQTGLYINTQTCMYMYIVGTCVVFVLPLPWPCGPSTAAAETPSSPHQCHCQHWISWSLSVLQEQLTDRTDGNRQVGGREGEGRGMEEGGKREGEWTGRRHEGNKEIQLYMYICVLVVIIHLG